MTNTAGVKLFCSYSHLDEKWRRKLSNSLAALRRSGDIEEWYDGMIDPGSDWDSRIRDELENADIVALIVSDNFIASDFCWGMELQRALELHAQGRTTVIPVVVSPCQWERTPLQHIEALPKPLKPIALWRPQDAGWKSVADGVARVVKQLAQRPAVAISAAAVSRRSSTLDDKPSKSPATRAMSAAAAAGSRSRSRLTRIVYDCGGELTLPGKVARTEGGLPVGDDAVDATYDAIGVVDGFFRNVFERNSIDDRGAPVYASVHYGNGFDNAFWNGAQFVIGDGSGELFVDFTHVDVIANEVMHGIIAADSKLAYYGESGALYNGIKSAFACLVVQYGMRQTADQAEWLLGSRVWAPGIDARALRSLAAPGTAYQNTPVGNDTQVAHMRDYVLTNSDNGGVNTNSGIPGHAFYSASVAIGGFAWERAGRVWYAAMRDPALPSQAGFADFARLTISHARRLFGVAGREATAIAGAWGTVGVVA
jgi:hypothetical protein